MNHRKNAQIHTRNAVKHVGDCQAGNTQGSCAGGEVEESADIGSVRTLDPVSVSEVEESAETCPGEKDPVSVCPATEVEESAETCPGEKDPDPVPHNMVDQSEYNDCNDLVRQSDDGSYLVLMENLRPGHDMVINIDESGVATCSVVHASSRGDTHAVNNHVDVALFDNDSLPRFRKRARDETNWKRNVNKRLRQQGKAYIRNNGVVVKSKQACLGVPLCREKCRRKCSTKIQDSQRDTLFNSYYEMETEDIKNMYLFKCISPVKPRVQRLDAQRHHQMSFRYSVSVDGDKVFVCKKALSSLHQISLSKIDLVTKQCSQGMSTPKLTNQGKHSNRPTKLSLDQVTKVEEHINKFPAEPSHYSRSHNTGRMYLSSTLSINKMYELYRVV